MLASLALPLACQLGCGAPAESGPDGELVGSQANGALGGVAFTQNPWGVTFTNGDGDWVIYTGCFGPAYRGGENLTVGPGYIARVVLAKATPAGNKIVDDEGPFEDAAGNVIGFTHIGHAGLGGFSWHHARGQAPFTLGPNQAWEISGRICAEDHGGFGVSAATIVDAPHLEPDGAGALAIDVDFTDAWTTSSPLMTVRYVYRVYESVVKMWAMVIERCPNGACGAGAPGPAYVGEPKFVSAVNGGGYRRLAMFNTENEIAQNSKSSNSTCLWTGASPTKATGQCDGDRRVRARFDYGTLGSGTDGGCDSASHRCLNTVMQAYPVGGDGSLTLGKKPALWEGGPFGLDAWAMRSATRDQVNPVDSPFGGAQWSCHGGSPGSENNRRWELVGLSNDGSGRYTNAGMYFHAWESGTGCYDCEPASRRFGPDGERFAVHAQFALNDGWSLD